MYDLSSFKVLAVDDDSISLNVIACQLEQLKPQLFFATDGETALNIIETESPDLILLDISMPGMSGLDVCRAVKQQTVHENLPIIFLTSSESDTAEAFAAGGVDYIIKPVDSDALQARVCTQLKLASTVRALDETNLLLSSANERLEQKVEERTRELVNSNANLRREINERRHLQDKLSFLSNHDFVTRMLNRFALEEKLTKLMASTAQSAGSYFLCLIDIDQFKVVNDTCGSIAGDELLRQLAEILKGQLDEKDLAARIGGDEFAVNFWQPDMGFALAKIKAIKAALENFEFNWNGEIFRHHISIGLVEVDNSIDSVSHLISVAERTCYQSKLKGGGEISVYNVTRLHVNKTQQQMRLVSIIQQALEEERIVLHAQGLFSNGSSHMEKAEVLSRLQDAAGRIQQPSFFIPVAEKYHIITAIDKYVLDKSLARLQFLPAHFQLSVNVSGEFIVDTGAVSYIESKLLEHNISPARLCLEIKESSAINNLNETARFTKQVKALGCEFTLDDFGTSTSSYEYLEQLAVDRVKIDGMFVRDVEADRVNLKMIESIVNLANAKNIEVVAGCVETSDAKKLLSSLNIDYLQGFALHRPESFEHLVNTVNKPHNTEYM